MLSCKFLFLLHIFRTAQDWGTERKQSSLQTPKTIVREKLCFVIESQHAKTAFLKVRNGEWQWAWDVSVLSLVSLPTSTTRAGTSPREHSLMRAE